MTVLSEVTRMALTCGALIAAALLVGYTGLVLRRLWDRRGKTYTVCAFIALPSDDMAARSPTCFDIDVVKAFPALVAFNAPMYRVILNGVGWCWQGQGWDGLGYLFPSVEAAREAMCAHLSQDGLDRVLPVTDLL